MWKIAHKRKNDTYVNDEAMEIGVTSNYYDQFEPLICLFMLKSIIVLGIYWFG